MNQIKAIETRYKGFRFRSRLEARYAVFFDSLGIKWDYEPEGFHLSNGVMYLPDFYLPEYDAWIEIKGKKADESELDKCSDFFNLIDGQSEMHDLLALGVPEITWDVVKRISDRAKEYGYDFEERADLLCHIEDIVKKRTKVYLFEGLLESGWFFADIGPIQIHVPNALYFLKRAPQEEVTTAFHRARSARFEYGEQP